MTKIAVFGAGTWGIALARLLAVHGKDVTVWSAIPAELKALSTTHRHPNLPGMELPATMHYTADIAEACAGRDVLLFAVPSPFVRATAKKAAPHIPDGQLIVDVAKGVEDKTLMTMSEIIEDELAKAGRKARVVALSGPTHAEEVARDMPTAIVAASATATALLPALVQLILASLAKSSSCLERPSAMPTTFTRHRRYSGEARNPSPTVEAETPCQAPPTLQSR